MTQFVITKHVEAPQEVAFDAAADFAGAPERIDAIIRVEMLTDTPVDLGTRFRETRIMFKQEATEELEVTQFDRPNSYSLDCENHGCRFHTQIRFKPNGSGTDIEMSFEATPLTAVAKVMSSLMKPMIDKMADICDKDLEDLKQAIESR